MDIKKTGIHLLKAFLISAVVSGLLLLLMAFILYKAGLSGMVEHILAAVVYVAGSFVGGFLLGKQEGKKRFLWGAAFGALYFLILLAVSMALSGSGEEGMWQASALFQRLRVLFLCVLGGMAGGMIS